MKHVLFLVGVIFFLFFASCVTSEASKEAALSESKNTETDQLPATSLTVPDKDELLEKQIEAAILHDIRIGSPDSLERAFVTISKNSTAAHKTHQLYLEIISELVQIVYPLDTRVPIYTGYAKENAYLNGIKAIRTQKYPYEMTQSDFLSCIIPTLLLITDPEQKDLLPQITEQLAAAAEFEPQSVLLSYISGLSYTAAYRSERALEQYKKAWSFDLSCYPAGIAYAQGLSKRGNTVDAIHIINTIRTQFPDQITVELTAAKIFSDAGDWDKADRIVQSVLQSDQNNTSAQLLRIHILMEQHEYLRANALLDMYSEKNKTNKTYLLLRARITHEWSKDLPKTLQFLDTAYTLYPKDIDVLLACAETLFTSESTMKGKPAIAFMNEALALNPNDTTALKLLVQYHLSQKNFNTALQKAKQLSSLYSSQDAQLLLIQAYVGVNNGAAAIQLAKELYQSSPSDETISTYVMALYATKNYAEVNSVIAYHMKNASSNLKSNLLYYTALITSDEDARLSALRSSLLANPRNEQSLYSLYRHYYIRTDYQKARYYLKQLTALKPTDTRYQRLEKELTRLLAQ